MEQVYLSTAFAFAVIGLTAFENWRAERRARKASGITGKDSDGRVWIITGGADGYIGGEFIEE